MTIRARRTRLYLLGAAILLAGWIGAAAIYACASDERSDTLGYEFVDGVAYPILAYESKSYRHDLERFGGKAAIMADDFNRWFSGLWIGQRLAYTLATLATAAALACFLTARRLPRDDSPRSSDRISTPKQSQTSRNQKTSPQRRKDAKNAKTGEENQ